TDKPGKLEAWVNFYFAAPADQQHPVQDILDIDKVFGMNVAAFTTEEICNIYVAPAGAQLFSISSHMHQRGKRFRIFRGAFRCAGGGKAGQECSPLSPELCPGGSCVDDAGQPGTDSLIYTSLIYNAPVPLRFDPPVDLSAPDAVRALTYCAL